MGLSLVCRDGGYLSGIAGAVTVRAWLGGGFHQQDGGLFSLPGQGGGRIPLQGRGLLGRGLVVIAGLGLGIVGTGRLAVTAWLRMTFFTAWVGGCSLYSYPSVGLFLNIRIIEVNLVLYII